MTRYQSGVLLGVFVGLLSLSGAQCNRFLMPAQDELRRLPATLPPSPTMAQVVEVVNRNNQAVQSFSTGQASLSGTGFPTLRATIAFERPMRLRLRADLPLGGVQELDVGSNDELFWFWVRHNDPPAVYYCRHGQFAGSAMRRVLPVDPYWVIESLGLVHLDPALPHQGPFARQDGNLEIRTPVATDSGTNTKVTILDPRRGAVLAQHLLDATNQPIVSAIAGRYRYDARSGAILPSSIEISAPATGQTQAFKLRLELNNVAINQPIPNAEQLWAMPSFENWPAVDLCGPGSPMGPGRGSPLSVMPGPGAAGNAPGPEGSRGSASGTATGWGAPGANSGAPSGMDSQDAARNSPGGTSGMAGSGLGNAVPRGASGHVAFFRDHSELL